MSDTPDPVSAAGRLLRERTGWVGDRLATLAWWTDPDLLRVLGPALAGLWPDRRPTLVAGVQSSGYLLAPLVATHLGVGMLGIQKQPQPDGMILLATVEETRVAGRGSADALGGKGFEGMRSGNTVPGRPTAADRVLLVDDVVESGAQAAAVRDLVINVGATWLGVATMVSYQPRVDLDIRSLTTITELTRARDGRG